MKVASCSIQKHSKIRQFLIETKNSIVRDILPISLTSSIMISSLSNQNYRIIIYVKKRFDDISSIYYIAEET